MAADILAATRATTEVNSTHRLHRATMGPRAEDTVVRVVLHLPDGIRLDIKFGVITCLTKVFHGQGHVWR
jgi:hypothetical protein